MFDEYRDQKFRNLIGFVGPEFLTYVLNSTIPIQINDSLREHQFSDTQAHAIDRISDLINASRVTATQVLSTQIIDDNHLLRENASVAGGLFNQIREQCGGEIAQYAIADEVSAHLCEIAKTSYPCLLITLPGKGLRSVRAGPVSRTKFLELLEADQMQSLTNGKPDLHASFNFILSDGSGINQQIVDLDSGIVDRAFQNCCNKLDFTLEALYEEIRNSLNSIRSLATGERISWSNYVGISGLYLEGIDEIDLGSCVVRAVRTHSNPHLRSKRVTTEHHFSEDSVCLSGCILEIRHSAMRTEGAIADNWHGDFQAIRQGPDYVDENELIDALLLAIVFVTIATDGVAATFRQSGFPIANGYGISRPASVHSNLVRVCPAQKDEILSWLNTLQSADVTPLRVAIDRIRSSIMHRSNPSDSVLDAFIALECIFSDSSETTFQVTAATTKYVYPESERRDAFTKLKKLYGVRSKLSHGKLVNKSKDLNPKEASELLIPIVLACLKKVLNDEELLKMNAPERVKEVLVYR